MAAATIVAVGLMPGTASAAQDASCSLQEHCYGVAIWGNDPPPSYGSFGTLNIGSCLYSPADNLTTEEMWQGTDNNPYGHEWVEVGATMGVGAPTSDGRYVFWAENTPSGGYNEVFPGSTVSLGTSYDMSMIYKSNDTWLVYFGLQETYPRSVNPRTTHQPGSIFLLAQNLRRMTAGPQDLSRTWATLILIRRK